MDSLTLASRKIMTVLILILLMTVSQTGPSLAGKITVERTVITKYKIPALTCFDKKVKKGPMALVIHWMGGSKEDMRDIGESLAKKGFFAVLPDLAGYGERASFGSPANGNLITFLMNSAKEFTAIIENYKKDPRVETSRIGMTGISLGGILTYLYCTMNSHIVAAAPMAGTPDWQMLTFGIGSDTYARSCLTLWEPVKHPERFYPCALLMLHGTDDRTVPIQGARVLYLRLKSFYSHTPNKLILKEYKGVGHPVTDEMKQEAITWLSKWTPKQKSGNR